MTPWLAKIIPCITMDHSDKHHTFGYLIMVMIVIIDHPDAYHTFRYLIRVMIVMVRMPLFALSSKHG